MKRIIYRIFQMVMKIGMYMLPWTMPEIIDGEHSSCNIIDDMKKRSINRILVVMGPHMMERGLSQPMLQEMTAGDIKYEVFDNITSDPTDLQVEAGVRTYKDMKAQAILLFGGGSPMDCGKAIAARIARPKKPVDKLQGVLKVRHRDRVPFIYAIPTTAGTGSETTMAAVITHHETHRKKSINDTAIIPHICVLDPTLTISVSSEITANTGMDALCHAVEAYTNNTYNTKLEKDMAKNAVKLIYDNLYTVYLNGSDIKARQNMQKAAFYAGRAFTRGCVGYVHAIGHAIGGIYGVPHGRAMAILLPQIMKAYGTSAVKRLAELADFCGISPDTNWHPGAFWGECSKNDSQDMRKAAAFIEWIEIMNKKMGIPDGFECIKAKDISQMAKWADEEANPLYPVPRIFNKKELEKIILKVKL